MILLLDNYDSFTYNLYDYLRQSGVQVQVSKNDALSLDDIATLAPSAIVLSYGPGRPEEAGITMSVIERFAGHIPLLGVCLGHQAIASAFGAKIIPCPQPTHGKTALIDHDGQTLFSGLPNPLRVARYHSLTVDVGSLPDTLVVTAKTPDGIVMAIRHVSLPVEGVQFHPEAIQTDGGQRMIHSFLARYTREVA